MKSRLLLPLVMVVLAVATMSYDVPKGWQRGGDYNYFVGTVPGGGKTGKTCATIKCKSCYGGNYGGRRHHREMGYGEMIQNFDAGNYRGKRIRLTGWVRSEDVTGAAGLWMKVGGNNSCDRHSTAYAHNYCSMPCENSDNMENRRMVGTEDWTRCEIVCDVPDGASNISYGARLFGAGQIWFENLKIEVVGRNVKTTGLPIGHNWKPYNMDFQHK
jgi:hypothetical protein